MSWGKIYETTWWGSGALDNNIGWGLIYRDYIDPTTAFEVLAENGDYLQTEQNEYIIIE
jgi:hypothetical protein